MKKKSLPGGYIHCFARLSYQYLTVCPHQFAAWWGLEKGLNRGVLSWQSSHKHFYPKKTGDSLAGSLAPANDFGRLTRPWADVNDLREKRLRLTLGPETPRDM